MRIFDSRTEEVAMAIVDMYIQPLPETEPINRRLAVEAKRYEMLQDLVDGNRSLEDLFSELAHLYI